jgi:hypothetical protein
MFIKTSKDLRLSIYMSESLIFQKYIETCYFQINSFMLLLSLLAGAFGLAQKFPMRILITSAPISYIFWLTCGILLFIRKFCADPCNPQTFIPFSRSQIRRIGIAPE